MSETKLDKLEYELLTCSQAKQVLKKFEQLAEQSEYHQLFSIIFDCLNEIYEYLHNNENPLYNSLSIKNIRDILRNIDKNKLMR
jgi:hypothetical protein